MPRYRSPFEKGELFIKFDVEFPPSHFADESTIMVSCRECLMMWFLREVEMNCLFPVGYREIVTRTTPSHSASWRTRRGS